METIPLSVAPAAGNLSSPVNHAHAVGGNQNNLQKKKQSRSVGRKWWGYYWYVAVTLKFLNNNISVTEAAWKAWQSNVYDHYIITVNQISDAFSDQPLSIESFLLVNLKPRTMLILSVAIRSNLGMGQQNFWRMLSSVRRSKGFTSNDLHHHQYHTLSKTTVLWLPCIVRSMLVLWMRFWMTTIKLRLICFVLALLFLIQLLSNGT